MLTFPTMDSGKVKSFEIESVFISLGDICGLLSRVDNVTDVQKRKPFGPWDEVHVRFKLNGHDCVVWEPFGDNSRYWVGPLDEFNSPDLGEVHLVFQQFRPTLLGRLFGGLMTLSFLRPARHRNGE